MANVRGDHDYSERYWLTFWGGMEDELAIDSTGPGTPVTATRITPYLPSGATIVKAYLIMKFREIYSAVANYIATAGTVQVEKVTGGTWTDGITLPAGIWDVPAGVSASGDCIVGDIDISGQIANETQVEFQLATLLANADGMKIRDLQFGVQVIYTI